MAIWPEEQVSSEEWQEYQDVLRILALAQKDEQTGLTEQEATEFETLHVRLTASDAYNRLLTRGASGQITIRPEFIQKISGGATRPTGVPPTDVPGAPGAPPPAPAQGQLDARQQLFNILTQKLQSGDTYEFPWSTYLQLLKDSKEKTEEKGQFRYSRSGTPGYVAKWKIDPVSGEETLVDIVPSSDEPKDTKPTTRYQQDEKGQWYQYEADENGNMIPDTVRPFGAAPKPKEPYTTELTPYQERFMEWQRKLHEEKYGEKTLADKIRLGLVVPETRGNKRGYLDIETNTFIETGDIETKPAKYLSTKQRRTGKRTEWGDYYVQDYDLMQDPVTGNITEVERGAPHVEEGEAGRLEAGYAPKAWAEQQAYGQKVAAALAPENTSSYLKGGIADALRIWATLGLPEQARTMDILKQQGVSFPGQPRYINSPGATGTAATIKAPEFPIEQIQNKPPTWLQAATRWR